MEHDIESERAGCPVYTAIGVIDGRWKPMLFQRLSNQPRGSGELHRMLLGVTKKVLREQLRQSRLTIWSSAGSCRRFQPVSATH